MGQVLDDRIRATIAGNSGVFNAITPLGVDQNEQLKSCAIDVVRDAVVALDPNGYVGYLNRAAQELYGWTLREVAGRTAKTTLFADGDVPFDLAWRTVCNKGEWRGEIAQRTRDGRERLIESRWFAVRAGQSSQITSILIVGTEISSREVTAAFAHEIKNPLAGIKGVADAFLERRQLTRQEREWMEAVRHEVSKIDARVRELLDGSQSRGHNVRLCSLNDLIRGVVVLATQQVRSSKNRSRRRISLEFIDSTQEPLIMPVDAARLEDAVLNLVLNAIEAIEGEGLVTVRLRRRATIHSFNKNGEAIIEVTDDGRGIPHEIRHRIFEPRFTTKGEGSGLGLAAVRRTATAHHGRITFSTQIGRGSKFVLALPLRSLPDPTERPA